MEQSKRTFKYGICGHVKEGFEPVINQLEKYYEMKYERNCQLCVYVGEECVIDIVMSNPFETSKTNKIDADSVTTIFSSGKTVGAILLAKMVDEGKIAYDDPISKHWPEFAQKGKEALKIEDLMRHEGGMIKFSKSMEPEWLFTEGLKQNKVGEVIEQETLDFPISESGNKREYHAETRELVGNEIFRRVHPEGKTFGQYLREDFGPEFGIENIYIGLPKDKWSQKVPYECIGGWQTMKELYHGPDKVPTLLSMDFFKQAENDMKA